MNDIPFCRYKGILYQIAHSAFAEAECLKQNFASDLVSCTKYSNWAHKRRQMIQKQIYHLKKHTGVNTRYRLKNKKYIRMQTKCYFYLCRRLCELADRQGNISSLCRLYGVEPSKLSGLISGQALAFRHTLACLCVTRNQHPNPPITDSLLAVCRAQQEKVKAFLQSDSILCGHRRLMLRDIADEFIFVANGLPEIADIVLLQNSTAWW